MIVKRRGIRRTQHFHIERAAAGRLRFKDAGAVDLEANKYLTVSGCCGRG